MKKNQHSRQAPDITAEACAWIAQLETGDLTPADVDAFREWISRSPRHAAEMKRLARLSADLDVLSGMAQPLRDAAAHYGPVVKRQSGRRFLLKFRTSVFAAMACLLLAVLFFFLHDPAAPTNAVVLETPIGGYEELTLTDGTVVKVNTNTRAEVTYEEGQRSVRLHWGEAFFQVARDPDRPFVVHAGGRSVEAMGTAFAVRFGRANFQVTVTEGRVQFDEISSTTQAAGNAVSLTASEGNEKLLRDEKRHQAPVVLEAGQRLVVTGRQQAPRVETLSEDEMDRELSWRDRVFAFSDTPLDEVVREVNRHTGQKIEITDPALRQLKFGGVFPTGDMQSLLHALEAAYGVEVEYVEDGRVLLSRSSSG